jgi:hypothetical protein
VSNARAWPKSRVQAPVSDRASVQIVQFAWCLYNKLRTNGVYGRDRLLVGEIAWAPTDTPTLPLPLDPADAKANAFKVYVVGAGSMSPVEPVVWPPETPPT